MWATVSAHAGDDPSRGNCDRAYRSEQPASTLIGFCCKPVPAINRCAKKDCSDLTKKTAPGLSLRRPRAPPVRVKARDGRLRENSPEARGARQQ